VSQAEGVLITGVYRSGQSTVAAEIELLSQSLAAIAPNYRRIRVTAVSLMVEARAVGSRNRTSVTLVPPAPQSVCSGPAGTR
jgi:hypothetical protein